MFGLERISKTISDVTVGTVIVLFHVALADRQRSRQALIESPASDRSLRASPPRARDL